LCAVTGGSQSPGLAVSAAPGMRRSVVWIPVLRVQETNTHRSRTVTWGKLIKVISPEFRGFTLHDA
jgi:hypothetical protein